ncbi:DUF3958 family protein [Listeria rustica]
MTQQMYQLELQQDAVRHGMRQIEKHEEFMHWHLKQKDRIFNEMELIWKKGKRAYQIRENIVEMNRYQNKYLNEIEERQLELKRQQQTLIEKEEELIQKRKRAWEEESL